MHRRDFLALGGGAAATTRLEPAFARSPDFGPRFVWGAATSSYQIEGSSARVGGGTSVWDAFCRRPGAIRDASSREIACDHHNLYREDVALMRALGVGAYRFSIAWPRVMPEGVGVPNAIGLGFYDRLVDSLLAAGLRARLPAALRPHARLGSGLSAAELSRRAAQGTILLRRNLTGLPLQKVLRAIDESRRISREIRDLIRAQRIITGR